MRNHDVSLESVPPGHRFNQYFKVWSPEKWSVDKGRKKDALKNVIVFDGEVSKLSEKLRERQLHSALLLKDTVFSCFAKSTAPFTTGLGIEHPVENGFAFLNPYGLPYLPGSSVKGVLRHAAEELASGAFGETRWNLVHIWWLFGFENWEIKKPQNPEDPVYAIRPELQEHSEQYELCSLVHNVYGKESEEYSACRKNPSNFLKSLWDDEKKRKQLHFSGTLRFWDVLPQTKELDIDILNPHYLKYYQGKDSPHDAGQPVPNFFLTIPPGSQFVFHVECLNSRLPHSLKTAWQDLINAAFNHAFDWTGFGAKTAVGYGVLQRDEQSEAEAKQNVERRAKEESAAAQKRKQEDERAAMLPEDLSLAELERELAKAREFNRKDINGPLPNKLSELRRGSDSWDQKHRSRLADLTEEVWKFLGWGNNKKKQQREEQIRKLREPLNRELPQSEPT